EALAEQEVAPGQPVVETGVTAELGPLRAQDEARALEEHRVRFDHGAGDVGENHLVIGSRAQMTPVQSAPLVALDVDERVEGVDRAKRAPVIEPEPAFAELIGSTRHGQTKRGAAGGELRAP